MKIAIITTEFLKDFVKDSINKLNFSFESEIHTYKDFSHVGDLYIELEDKFDGFAVSGPIPKQAIIKKVINLKKPLVDFGTDLQSYYEMFFKLMYKYNTLDFSRAYFDLFDWTDNPKSISYYLATGTLEDFMCELHKVVEQKSLDEIAQMEKNIAEKHIRLWNEGKIDFSTTRFSSIVPQLQQAGVNFHFIYPSISLLKSTFNELIKDIHINEMKVNQSAIIYITVKQDRCDNSIIDKVLQLLNSFKKDNLTDFIIEKNSNGFKIFTKLDTIKTLTQNFTTCPIKSFIENKLNLKVCIGYGIGNHINEALSNAIIANKEANSNSNNYSFIINENCKLIGPLSNKRILTISNEVTPYIEQLSKEVKLSTLTIQKLISVIDNRKTTEISPQELASCLNVTVRTANRFLSSLLRHNKAKIIYEKQNSTKGRPEKVYQLLINVDKLNEDMTKTDCLDFSEY